MSNETDSGPPLQVTLKHCLLLTAYVAAVFAPLAAYGWRGYGLMFLCAVPLPIFIFLLVKKKFQIIGWIFAGFVCLCLLPPSLSHPLEELHHSRCTYNLKQIATACFNYESDHGHFPPPFTTDEHGNRLHSWRVLILPYLELNANYEQIDLTKPWDDPANAAVAENMPDIFSCPRVKYLSRWNAKSVETAYVAVIGERTAWRPKGERTFGDFMDGLSNSILILESHANRLHWMSPYDPEIEDVGPGFLGGSPNKHKPQCVDACGITHSISPEHIDQSQLLNLLQIDDQVPTTFYDW